MLLMIEIDNRTVVDEVALVFHCFPADWHVHCCVPKIRHISLIPLFVNDYLFYLRSQPLNVIDAMKKIEAVKA